MKKTEKGKEFLQELGTREASTATSHISSSKSAFTSRLVGLVPTRIQWMIPWLQQNAQVPSPTLESLRGQAQELTQTDPLDSQSALTPAVESSIGVKNLFYPKYRCPNGNPLACNVPQQTILQQPDAKFCSQCGFPTTLPPETKIQGNRGTYQIEHILEHRGKGRLYQAFELPNRQPVVIKEYLLPESYFNQQEALSRKTAFKSVASLSLADGRVQDFRLIVPVDAIAPPFGERCYLVTQGNLNTSLTLTRYLAHKGAMTNRQVRHVLNQVLQSLEFLHDQKFRLPSGLVKQGVTHGNLSLDNLLFAPTFQGFFIYLSDLALWEHLFNPPLTQPLIYSVAQDLQDLGYIAFYLLAGGTYHPVSLQLLDPRVETHWPSVDIALKNFILNLIGIGLVSYKSAEIAREALLKLPPDEPELEVITSPAPEEEVKAKRSRRLLWFLLLGALGLLLLGILLWFMMRRTSTRTAIASEPLTCCINQISSIPPGTFSYTGEENGTWSYVLERNNLIAFGKTLETELQLRQPKLKLNYQPEDSPKQAIAKVRSERASFAVTSLVNNLDTDLTSQTFAHDGLVVFVAFSYARRTNSLPQALEGKITFEQLRQLYTGQITKWNQLYSRLPDLTVKLYIPAEAEAVKIFEERVLKDKPAIDAFQRLINKDNQPNSLLAISTSGTITRLGTFETLRSVIQDFEDRSSSNDPGIGAIAFGTLSKVFGQCSVYPLALVDGDKPPVSPLVQNAQQPVTPQTDLCNNKGGYSPNVQAFINQEYPLAYPLAVVYPRDNRQAPVGEKFAEILRTVEAQRLLSKTGLVPLQPF